MIKGVIVVAHPDDDALFATPIQTAMSHVGWHVVSVTYDRDHPRGAELLKWQGRLGCDHVDFLGFADSDDELVSGQADLSCEEVTERVRPYVDAADVVVTHNDIGEYGHPRHGLVHQALKALDIGSKAIYFAHGYRCCDFKVRIRPYVEQACECFPTQAQVISRLHRRYTCCRVGYYFRHEIPEDSARWVALPHGQSKYRLVRLLHLLLGREKPRCR